MLNIKDYQLQAIIFDKKERVLGFIDIDYETFASLSKEKIYELYVSHESMTNVLNEIIENKAKKNYGKHYHSFKISYV